MTSKQISKNDYRREFNKIGWIQFVDSMTEIREIKERNIRGGDETVCISTNIALFPLDTSPIATMFNTFVSPKYLTKADYADFANNSQ